MGPADPEAGDVVVDGALGGPASFHAVPVAAARVWGAGVGVVANGCGGDAELTPKGAAAGPGSAESRVKPTVT